MHLSNHFALNILPLAGNGERPVLSPSRPKVNAILHLYGKWLFEAAFIGTEFVKTSTGTPGSSALGGNVDANPTRPTTLGLDQPQARRVSSSSQHSNSAQAAGASLTESLELPASLTPEKFESGRAEALGTLCRILCSKKSGEEILPIYLARFYLAVQQGIIIGPVSNITNVLLGST